ncbi:MAG: hypothetical protein DRJ03_25535 [Chloroflexi bacterium]|nr:MAG: hypothetical protein DRJ03_25535 [Chloroflexota bacterium]
MLYLKIRRNPSYPILGIAQHKFQREIWGFVLATNSGVQVYIPSLNELWMFSFKYWMVDPLTKEYIKANWK